MHSDVTIVPTRRYCPKCPPDFPQCFKKNPTWGELQVTHSRVHAVFDNDPDQPPVMKVQ